VDKHIIERQRARGGGLGAELAADAAQRRLL
jgi:hypothetical protein